MTGPDPRDGFRARLDGALLNAERRAVCQEMAHLADLLSEPRTRPSTVRWSLGMGGRGGRARVDIRLRPGYGAAGGVHPELSDWAAPGFTQTFRADNDEEQ